MPEFPDILHAIADHAGTIPGKAAIIEAETDRKCSYGELWAHVKAFSGYLKDSGVKRDFGDGYGTRVVVRCAQTIDFVVAALAIQLAGGVFVPVEKNIAEARIIEIMEETDSKILIALKPLSDYAYTYIPLADATGKSNKNEDANIIFPDPETLAEILFTTGTTGKSKGVMHSHRSLIVRTISIYSIFDHDDKEIWLIPNPLSHINGLLRINIALISKCVAVVIDGYMIPKTFFSAITKYEVTIINFLSSAVEMYLRMYGEKLKEIHDQINYLCLSSSSFPESQINLLTKIFNKSRIIELYGSTEAYGCFSDHSNKKNHSSHGWQPGYDVDVVFYNEQKTMTVETNYKTPGLFALKSNANMMGYWKNPELTSSVTRDNFIILSDLGFKGEEKHFHFIGRADDIIISGAYKISPIEIEDAVNAFENIRESACIPVNDPIMGQVPKLLVVMNDNHTFNATEIISFLKNKLEASRIPRYIEEIDEIPKINDKINRKELRSK